MKSGWIKHFNDGTLETGWDQDIVTKKSSWSKGRLDGLVGVDIIVSDLMSSLSVPGGIGAWHQSDSYVSVMSMLGKPVPAKLKHRQVQYRLQPDDIGKLIYEQGTSIFVLKPLPSSAFGGGLCMIQPIEEEHIGKWITLRMFPNGSTELKFMGRRT